MLNRGVIDFLGKMAGLAAWILAVCFSASISFLFFHPINLPILSNVTLHLRHIPKLHLRHIPTITCLPMLYLSADLEEHLEFV
jgi:hypothetical protein